MSFKPLALLSLVTVVRANEVSEKVLNFVSYWNGKFDNELQTQQPGDNHALAQVRVEPVDIDCFRPNPVLLVEEASSRVLRFIVLVVVTDGIEDTVSLTYYTFVNPSNYKPRKFKVESLYNMSCGAFHKVENCTGSYRVADGYVFGNFPECNLTVDGKHPRYTVIHTCDSVTGTAPQNAGEPSPIEPYEFLYTQKFPVINPPKGYVAPCGSKVDNITNVTNQDE
ncbi:hypothetical protein BsWGS_23132 [Bradybaena similaris]